MRIQSDPNGVQNPQEKQEDVVSELVCSAEFAQGCMEPLEDSLTDEIDASEAEDIQFSETVCSAEFKGGCIDPEDEKNA
ncbi:MAG TPA: hypothetical protein PKE04_07730 [Clostridia bacterium]|nr:hypothetical protein [Clostridia bacterium]